MTNLTDERISQLWYSQTNLTPSDGMIIQKEFARAIEAEAYRAGQEAMRERAAKECYAQADDGECPERAVYCGNAIQALPIEGVE